MSKKSLERRERNLQEQLNRKRNIRSDGRVPVMRASDVPAVERPVEEKKVVQQTLPVEPRQRYVPVATQKINGGYPGADMVKVGEEVLKNGSRKVVDQTGKPAEVLNQRGQCFVTYSAEADVGRRCKVEGVVVWTENCQVPLGDCIWKQMMQRKLTKGEGGVVELKAVACDWIANHPDYGDKAVIGLVPAVR